MRLVEWRSMPRGSLRGFGSVELADGLVPADVAMHPGVLDHAA